MGPFLGPFAAALLAALIAGAALGLTRLSRRSLEWWRRLRAPRAEAPAFDLFPEDAIPPVPHGFPGVHAAIACAVGAAACIGLAALGRTFALGAPPALPEIGRHPFDPATFVPRALGVLAFAAIAFAATLALALVSAVLDVALRRGLSWAFARLKLASSARTPADAGLSIADLRAGASGLWQGGARGGEPFGVGVGFVALFVTPVAAIALLLRAAPATARVLGTGPLPPEALLLFAVLFLAVPAGYAAAAERSQREEGARLRRRAALRQLVAAPLWALALLALGAARPGEATLADLPAWIVLALAVLLALPGTTGARALLVPPRGGDVAEPSAVVRAMTGLAHHGWLAAWAGFAALALASRGGAPVMGLSALGILGALLAGRALAFSAWSRA
ncbi:MAG: hypothetical protein ABI960_04085 [Candidatus Eisenbacteria bacterium]